MKEEILNLIKKGGGVSFVELERIKGFSGNLDMFIGSSNVIFWQNISGAAIDAIQELLNERKIIMHPSVLIVYLHDGKYINLPICKNLKTKYKKPHWLPVVFWTPEQLNKGKFK